MILTGRVANLAADKPFAEWTHVKRDSLKPKTIVRTGRALLLDRRAVSLHAEPEQGLAGDYCAYICGLKLHQRMSATPMLLPGWEVVRHLLANQELIPESWAFDRAGVRRQVCFWGSLWRLGPECGFVSQDRRVMGAMIKEGPSWQFYYRTLGESFLSNHVSAVIDGKME